MWSLTDADADGDALMLCFHVDMLLLLLLLMDMWIDIQHHAIDGKQSGSWKSKELFNGFMFEFLC